MFLSALKEIDANQIGQVMEGPGSRQDKLHCFIEFPYFSIRENIRRGWLVKKKERRSMVPFLTSSQLQRLQKAKEFAREATLNNVLE